WSTTTPARGRRFKGGRQHLFNRRAQPQLGQEDLCTARDIDDCAGKVDHGFDKASIADVRKRLTPLVRKTQPYTKRIAHKGVWVEPELLAEIEYRAKSAEGKVRHPFFKGIREDL